MVAAWRERREHPVEVGLGLMDLFSGRDTPRAHVAALVLGDALHRICAYYPTPQQARDMARKKT